MSTNQRDNVVGGSLAGRDLTVNHNYAPQGAKTQIAHLCERLRAQGNVPQTDADASFIEELQHYFNRPASDLTRTLADKLNQSGRPDLVTTAEEMKERAMKRIMRFQSSHTAQEIFAYVLGELHARFVLHVSPLVATGAARAEIDAAMEARVVTPVAESLEPSPLNLSPALVLAFLFFLAGNCHVKWD